MEKIIPISDLQTRAKKIVESVKRTRCPVLITQRGRPAALLVNYEDYVGMIATLEEISQPDWRERLAEAGLLAKGSLARPQFPDVAHPLRAESSSGLYRWRDLSSLLEPGSECLHRPA